MKKSWIFVLILVVLFAGGGTFAYLYFTSNKTASISSSPSPTAKASPSKSPQKSPTPTPAPSPSKSGTTKVKVFMIAENDNGKTGKLVGCGDSAVAIEREVPETQTVLKAAMEQLVSIKDKNIGESGLYNPLYNSSLNLDSATITDGNAIVKFSGILQLVGTCEDARIQAQFKETALQFPTVGTVQILINGKDLDDLISQEG